MKVGTDGVLLGAWVNINQRVERILDVGTGTGLIALMMAQRSLASTIHAVELNECAYHEAVGNLMRSSWSKRLSCYHTSVQIFSNEFAEKYDLIVANPPFYKSTNNSALTNRAMARESSHMPFNELLLAVSKLLNKKGACAFIVPFIEQERFIDLAQRNGLFISRITHVKGNFQTQIKRSLLQFSFVKNNTSIDELVIESSRHIYTKDYIELVNAFYIKM